MHRLRSNVRFARHKIGGAHANISTRANLSNTNRRWRPRYVRDHVPPRNRPVHIFEGRNSKPVNEGVHNARCPTEENEQTPRRGDPIARVSGGVGGRFGEVYSGIYVHEVSFMSGYYTPKRTPFETCAQYMTRCDENIARQQTRSREWARAHKDGRNAKMRERYANDPVYRAKVKGYRERTTFSTTSIDDWA